MIPCTPFWLWIRFSVSSTSACKRRHKSIPGYSCFLPPTKALRKCGSKQSCTGMIKQTLPTLVCTAKCLYFGATFSAWPFQLFSICISSSLICDYCPGIPLSSPPQASCWRLAGESCRLPQFRCQTKIIFENVHGIYEKSRKKIHCGCQMTFPFIKWMPKAITNKRREGENHERTLFVYNSDLCWDGRKAVTTANTLQLKKEKCKCRPRQ